MGCRIVRLMRLMESLTSDPGDSLLNLAAAAAAKRRGESSRRQCIKSTISSPCCFSHVTQLDRTGADDVMRPACAPSPPVTAPGRVA